MASMLFHNNSDKRLAFIKEVTLVKEHDEELSVDLLPGQIGFIYEFNVMTFRFHRKSYKYNDPDMIPDFSGVTFALVDLAGHLGALDGVGQGYNAFRAEALNRKHFHNSDKYRDKDNILFVEVPGFNMLVGHQTCWISKVTVETIKQLRPDMFLDTGVQNPEDEMKKSYYHARQRRPA